MLGIRYVGQRSSHRDRSPNVLCRSQQLSLTASLKAAQVASALLLMRTSVRAATTRILIQNALSRYNMGNNTAQNWVNAASDLSDALNGGTPDGNLVQAQIYAKNATGPGGPFSVLNATASTLTDAIPLPYHYPNGTQVFLGDDDSLGYPQNLYPNLTYSTTPYNSTFSEAQASYAGQMITADAPLLLGPWMLNSTYGLVSITLPIINNTSSVDVLGFMTVLADISLITDVIYSSEGLDTTGITTLIGPTNVTNNFLPGILYSSNNGHIPENVQVRFVVPPNNTDNRNTQYAFGGNQSTFDYTQYPAVKTALTENHRSVDNSGTLISTHNEQNASVSVGYALPNSIMVNWVS